MKNDEIKNINGYAISSFILSLPIVITYVFYSIYGSYAGVVYDFTHYESDYAKHYYLALLVIISSIICMISIMHGIIALVIANNYIKKLRVLAIVGIIISIAVPIYVYVPRLLRPWDECGGWCSNINTTIQMNWNNVSHY